MLIKKLYRSRIGVRDDIIFSASGALLGKPGNINIQMKSRAKLSLNGNSTKGSFKRPRMNLLPAKRRRLA